MNNNYDYIIAGAGIIGLTLAYEIKMRLPEARILVLEKENREGFHASGRNSGVIHSGIYYPKDSLKAKTCKIGGELLRNFCIENKIPINNIGKILLPTKESDLLHMDLIYNRAIGNEIGCEILDGKDLENYEPQANRALGKALYVKSTSVSNPMLIIQKLSERIKLLGIDIFYDEPVFFINKENKSIILRNQKTVNYGHFVNAAGLYSDKIAKLFSVGLEYSIIPIKGNYWKLNNFSGIKLNHLIYPIPDLNMPFLGVHTTTIDNNIFLGPTASISFGRENYSNISGFNLLDGIISLSKISKQFFLNKNNMRRYLMREIFLANKYFFCKEVNLLVPAIKYRHIQRSKKVGIRAQLYSRSTGEFVNDFVVFSSNSSTHILNAVSPGWTSSFAFAKYICSNELDL
jgi:L-2-hydroxyglutarate oxidase LhgO